MRVRQRLALRGNARRPVGQRLLVPFCRAEFKGERKPGGSEARAHRHGSWRRPAGLGLVLELLPRDDVHEEVEDVRLGDGAGDVAALEGAPLVLLGVGPGAEGELQVGRWGGGAGAESGRRQRWVLLVWRCEQNQSSHPQRKRSWSSRAWLLASKMKVSQARAKSAGASEEIMRTSSSDFIIFLMRASGRLCVLNSFSCSISCDDKSNAP